MRRAVRIRNPIYDRNLTPVSSAFNKLAERRKKALFCSQPTKEEQLDTLCDGNKHFWSEQIVKNEF